MKRLKRFFMKRPNGGFTLVEMVVAVAVLSILMVGMVLTVAPILRTFNDNSRDLVAENVSTCIQNYISLSMRDATNVVIFGNTNEESIKANGNSIVNGLKTFSQTKTGADKDAYVMHCIHLKYDTADARYYLISEPVDVSQKGDNSDPITKTKQPVEVFSKCFYNDLYFSFDIEKALDMDKEFETPQPRLNDTIQITVNTYSDANQNNMVFNGTGLTEFREIGREIARKNTASKYSLKMYSGKELNLCDGFSTSDAEDDARDIFIFYTSYNFAGGKK